MWSSCQHSNFTLSLLTLTGRVTAFVAWSCWTKSETTSFTFVIFYLSFFEFLTCESDLGCILIDLNRHIFTLRILLSSTIRFVPRSHRLISHRLNHDVQDRLAQDHDVQDLLAQHRDVYDPLAQGRYVQDPLAHVFCVVNPNVWLTPIEKIVFVASWPVVQASCPASPHILHDKPCHGICRDVAIFR